MSAHNAQNDPRKIEDLRAEALRIRAEIATLSSRYDEAISQRMKGGRLKTPASAYIRRIADLDDRLNLIVSEYLDRRRI